MGATRQDRLLSVRELADYLGVATSTLYSWRTRGEGPPGYRVGGQLRFRLSEVDAWIAKAEDGAGRS